jgi:DNA-binding transcriptional regulator/RsmH inhibitor MraZ
LQVPASGAHAVLPTLRLSPKHQVTIPAEGRALVGAGDGVLCGRTHAMPRLPESLGDDAVFPVVLLMSRTELRRREQVIRDDASIAPLQREALAMKLRATVVELAFDGQNRVVLPQVFIDHLRLERDVFFVVMNDSMRVWNPEHYQRWSGPARSQHGVPYDPSLDSYLFA